MRDRIEPVLGGSPAVNYDTNDFPADNLAGNTVRVSRKPAFFEFSGRISLSRYWVYHGTYVVILPTALLLFLLAGLRHEPVVLLVAAALVALAGVLISLSLTVRRARDLGWSPALGVLTLVPLVGVILALLFAALPGRNKPNRFGPPNPRLTRLELVGACAIVLFTFTGSIALLAYFPDFPLAQLQEVTGGLMLRGSEY